MFKHTWNPSLHTEKYIMHLRAPYVSRIFLPRIFVSISKPEILQQYASVFVNNRKKASTFLWLMFQIWPQFPSSSYHAVPGTLGVTFQSCFWLLCPVYDISVHSDRNLIHPKNEALLSNTNMRQTNVFVVKYISWFQFIDLLRATTMRNNSNLLSIHINNLRKFLF